MRVSWVAIGLVVSLAVNLFLIGAAAGVIALGVRMAHDNARPRPGVFGRALGDLPESQRSAMRQMLRDAWGQARGSVQQSRRLRLDAWGALGEAKPDPAVIKRELAQSRQLDSAARSSVEEKVVDYVLTLAPDDRARFAAGMRRVLTPMGPAAPAPASNQAAP